MIISTVFVATLFCTLYSFSTINAGVLHSNETIFDGAEAGFPPNLAKTLQHKLDVLTGTLRQIDTSVKQLQEQAHTWAIFRHHIDAWNDQMKTLESKLDLVKRTQDEQQAYSNKLTSLELTLNHILSKVVYLADTNSMPTIVNQAGLRQHSDQLDLAAILKVIERSSSADKKMKTELTTRLSNILRHVQNIENDECGRSRRGLRLSPASSVSGQEFRQLHVVVKQNALSLSSILESAMNTERRLDEHAQHLHHMTEQCQSVSGELSTFTESSDLLLKRIEWVVHNVSEKLSCLECHRKKSSNAEDSDDDVVEEDDEDYHRRVEHDDSDRDVDNHVGKELERNHTDENCDGAYCNGANKTHLPIDPNVVDTKPPPNVDAKEHTDDEGSDVSLGELEFIQPDKIACHELDGDHERADGIYKFSSPELNQAGRNFNERYCAYATNDDIAWTVIQNRGPYAEQENFNRSWAEYRHGFGCLDKDFWFGNEFIHQLVYRDDYELRIELEDFDGVAVWAQYSIFRLEPEDYNYNLLVGGYTGAVPDALAYNNEMDFSAYDRRNDKSVDACCACATGYASGWWFNQCTEANLNGVYHETPTGHNYVGIIWEHWHGDYSLKRARMLIRPKQWTPESEETRSVHNDASDEDP